MGGTLAKTAESTAPRKDLPVSSDETERHVEEEADCVKRLESPGNGSWWKEDSSQGANKQTNKQNIGLGIQRYGIDNPYRSFLVQRLPCNIF